MKLSLKEKELLSCAAQSSIGLIRVPLESSDAPVATSLLQKGLLKHYETKHPFCCDKLYWSLTDKGWKYLD